MTYNDTIKKIVHNIGHITPNCDPTDACYEQLLSKHNILLSLWRTTIKERVDKATSMDLPDNDYTVDHHNIYLQKIQDTIDFWQIVLGLDNWSITYEVQKTADMGDGRIAHTWYETYHRIGTIYLMHPMSFPADKLLFFKDCTKVELSIVHELLHMYFGEHDMDGVTADSDDDSVHSKRKSEQVINHLTDMLVGFRTLLTETLRLSGSVTLNNA